MLPPESHRPRSKRRWILWLVLALIALAIAWVLTSDSPFAEGVQELVGSKHDQAILDSSFSISPHVFRYYKFALPEGSMNVAVVGQFTAAAESRNNTRGKDEHKDQDNDNTIEVYVLTEPAFTIWQNGYATSSLYESGKVAEGTVQMQLPAGPGIYYLVFSNRSSTKTAKAVRASVLLRYKSWLPEWFRRMKDRFWNWIGV